VYAGNVNLLAGNINTTKHNTETLLQTSKEVCLAVNTDKTNMWPSSLGVGRGANNSSLLKTACYETLPSALKLAGSCEHGNERLGSIKAGKFLTE
jgi:hypothetical protein